MKTISTERPNLRATLLLCCLAQFMVILDVSVVNVAPSLDPRLAAVLRAGPAVGRQRLHGHVRRLPAARRPRR
jgi:hypothetical protein